VWHMSEDEQIQGSEGLRAVGQLESECIGR